MKKLVMNTSIAGLNWSARLGETVEMTDDEADRMVAAGYAVEVETGRKKAKAKVETATKATADIETPEVQ